MPSSIKMRTLLRSCGKGNTTSCQVAKHVRAIYAGSVVTFSSAGNGLNSHPNKMPFNATLLVCDEPSDKPPHGAQGHRILVTSRVAKSKLNGLPGMAVNYDPSDMDEHATQNKVGVITKAWMEGPEVKIAGFVWKKDFPNAERDLKRKDLGTSMELADVFVKNEHAPVWELNDFEFTGATILKRNAAAYTKTSLSASKDSKERECKCKNKGSCRCHNQSLSASAKAAVHGEEGEKQMAVKEKKRKVAAAEDTKTSSGQLALMTQALSGSLTQTLGPMFNELKASAQRQEDRMEEFIQTQAGLRLIDAAAEDEDDDEVVLHAAKEDESDDEMEAAKDESDESDDMEAAGGKKPAFMDNDDSDESASDSSASDASELEAMEDLELEHPDESTGEVNKDATNRGSKTIVTKPPKQGEHFKGNVAKGRLHSSAKKGAKMKFKKPFPGLEAAAEQLRTVHASNRKLSRTIQAMEEKHNKTRKYVKQLKASYQALEGQLEVFAERESRRSAMPVELVNLAAKSGYNLGEIKASGQVLGTDAVDHMFAVAASQGIRIEPEQRIAMKMSLEQHGLMDTGEIDRGHGRVN